MQVLYKVILLILFIYFAWPCACVDFSSPLRRIANSISCLTENTNLRLYDDLVLSGLIDTRIMSFDRVDSFTCENHTISGSKCSVLTFNDDAVNIIRDCFTTYGLHPTVGPCWHEHPLRTIYWCVSMTFSHC